MIMIEDQRSFEAALERAAAWLAQPPEPGTREDRSFLALLEDIDRYQPDALAQAADPDPLIQKLEDLNRGLADFSLHYPELDPKGSHPTAFGPGFGFGKDLRGDR